MDFFRLCFHRSRLDAPTKKTRLLALFYLSVFLIGVVAAAFMYKIANIFNWIEFACGIIVVICGILMAVGAVNGSHLTGEAAALAASGPSVMIGLGIYVIIITIVIIILTRKAYAKGSSKGWDIAFMASFLRRRSFVGLLSRPR